MLPVNIIQNLLMPSSLVLVLIIAGFVLLWKKKRKRLGEVFLVAGILFFYLMSIAPVSDFLLMSLEEKYNVLDSEKIGEADTAVLLLGGRESNVLRGSEALRLWHLSGGNMELIISGIDPLSTKEGEASNVRNFFTHRGVSPEDIRIEGESRNTRENVLKVGEMVGEEPFFLVTSAYHMERSVREFKRIGADPVPAPTDFKRRRNTQYGPMDFLPSGQSLRNSDLAFHEHIGTFYYRILFLLKGKEI